jgi:hypothetical protein
MMVFLETYGCTTLVSRASRSALALAHAVSFEGRSAT